MSHAQAAHYRRRAAHLRTLADQLTHTPSMSLQSHSTLDTWQGPLAQECNDHLAAAQRAVHLAVEDLGIQAWRFDRTADELEAAALRADLQRIRDAEVTADRARDHIPISGPSSHSRY